MRLPVTVGPRVDVAVGSLGEDGVLDGHVAAAPGREPDGDGREERREEHEAENGHNGEDPVLEGDLRPRRVARRKGRSEVPETDGRKGDNGPGWEKGASMSLQLDRVFSDHFCQKTH